MLTDIWDAQRKHLEAELVKAALALAEHTGADNFGVPVPNTSPQMVVVMSQVKSPSGKAEPTTQTAVLGTITPEWDTSRMARLANGIVSDEKDYYYFGLKDLRCFEQLIRTDEKANHGK